MTNLENEDNNISLREEIGNHITNTYITTDEKIERIINTFNKFLIVNYYNTTYDDDEKDRIHAITKEIAKSK